MSEPFERLEATYGNGHAIQDIMRDDYMRIGISRDDARRMIHGDSDDPVADLVGRMEQGEKEYYGIREDSLLAGFAVLGHWKANDERPFMKPGEFYTARLFEKRDEILGSGEPSYPYDGIHAFGVADFVEDYEAVAVPLLSGVKVRAAERGKVAIRAAIDVKDKQLLDLLEREGQAVNRKLGKIPLGGVTRGYSLFEIETA